ncbi:MAG: hypothetical protein BAJATHORv1_30177 [Candidatus Thorarchaeota archaeon]|nr:MAG: hypothetical protein BAJATHORv1_30177 [Candidatus Thorarchaeota archaeon]
MKILHISEYGLPDPRIERLAIMSSSYTESHFLGGLGHEIKLFENAFESITNTDFFTTAGKSGIPYYYQKMKESILKEVDRIDPDIIYAHNVIAAKIVSDLPKPFIYDDHEYWSRQVLIKRVKNKSFFDKLKNRLRYFWLPKVYRKWEKKVLAKAASVVTVSEAIALEHREKAGFCYVIPNFPLRQEIGEHHKPKAHSGNPKAICLSSDFGGFLEHRNPGTNLEAIQSVGGVEVDWVGRPPKPELTWFKHRDWIEPSSLLEVLTKNYQFGLIPWIDYWYHRYSMPNKAATYSHAGLIFVLNKDFKSIIHMLPKYGYYTYENQEELKVIIRKLRDLDTQELLKRRVNLQNWARENVVLDKYAKTLRRAIEHAGVK